MEDKQNQKPAKVSPKSFLAVGPTLHYSHQNVHVCWLFAVAVFVITCLFWSEILTGSFWSFNPQDVISLDSWFLGRFVTSGVSIFEYPWQILVLGLLMAILAVVPVLISQLMSFRYSLPFILAVFFLTNLPVFAVCLLISCIAAACRPLRFRSRFIAIALCMTPQLAYWGFLGSTRWEEPLAWGFSFMPWISAWIVSLAVGGLVLGIGHYTRYKPGLVLTFTVTTLLIAFVVFLTKIGFVELDYQLYVAKNNPEQVNEFHDHAITQALDNTIKEPAVNKYLSGFFYPKEPIPLRAELKKEIQVQLGYDRWPAWFMTSPELRYQARKQRLLEQYELFIARHPKSRRMPISLYFKAMLSEYNPDIKTLGQNEMLHFYNDYPFERSRKTWYWLYEQFGDSPESIEARWRIAMHWAGQGRFTETDELLVEAQSMSEERLKLLENKQSQNGSFFSPFSPPADSVITEFKLTELQRKLSELRDLISEENRTQKPDSAERLATFVRLNPYGLDYGNHLENLLKQMRTNDPLRDNILLAQIKLIADEHLRAERLAKLHEQFQGTDGGMKALHELALLQISMWRQHTDADSQQKKKYLADARATLTSFLSLYPESSCAEHAKKNLDDLPKLD